jgi:AcrR family transcriptional regulator
MERDASRRIEYGDGRRALLDATVAVVARSGLRGLTYRAVADEAGVTHGLIVHHFGSRDALVAAALQQVAEGSIDRSRLEPDTGALSDLAGGLGEMVSTSAEREAFVYEMVLEGLRNPALLEDVRAVYRTYVDAARRTLDGAGLAEESGALARLLMAALDGLVLQQLIFGRPDDTEAAVAQLRELLGALAEQRRAAS